jgi:hypothetical protein
MVNTIHFKSQKTQNLIGIALTRYIRDKISVDQQT